MKRGCDLCQLERRTQWFYEDSRIVICKCETCGAPLIVFRPHGNAVLTADRHHARETAGKLFGNRILYYKTRGKSYQDHEHWHIVLRREDL